MNRAVVASFAGAILVGGHLSMAQGSEKQAAPSTEVLKVSRFPEVFITVETEGEATGKWRVQLENRMRWDIRSPGAGAGNLVELFLLKDGKWQGEPAYNPLSICGNWSKTYTIPSGAKEKIEINPPTLHPETRTFRDPGTFCILMLLDDGKKLGYVTSPAYVLKTGKLETVPSAPTLNLR